MNGNILAIGEQPENWSIGNIVPMFNKGGRDQATNYRSASLKTAVRKLLENIIGGGISNSLESQGQIRESVIREISMLLGKFCLTNLNYLKRLIRKLMKVRDGLEKGF